MTNSIRSAALSVVLLFVATATAFADVQKVEGLLRRAEANLKSVESSLAGRTSPPKGSAGKLVAQRLKQAFGDLEPAGKLVAALPADGEGVTEVTTRYNDAVKLYQKLAAIMNGGSEPKKEGPKDGEVKLGYPHADNFKNALFTFRQKVEGPANSLTKLHAELLPVKDQMTINHRTTAQAMATIAEARRQAGFVEQGLAKIPANGEGVADAKANLAKALETIRGAESYFAPLNAQLLAMIDPAKFPQFDTDRKRLQGLSGDYSQDWIFTENRARAAELFQQRQAAQDELVRIATVYQRLMQQQTQMGKTIEAVGNGTIQSFSKFDAKITEQKAALPASIREDLAEANRLADDAVQNQKPLWFTGGIPQRMDWATDKLALLKVIDPATPMSFCGTDQGSRYKIPEAAQPWPQANGSDTRRVLHPLKSRFLGLPRVALSGPAGGASPRTSPTGGTGHRGPAPTRHESCRESRTFQPRGSASSILTPLSRRYPSAASR